MKEQRTHGHTRPLDPPPRDLWGATLGAAVAMGFV